MTVKSKMEMTLNQVIGFAFIRCEFLKIVDFALTIRVFKGANLIPRITPLQDVLKRGSSGFRDVKKYHNWAAAVHCLVNVADTTPAKKEQLCLNFLCDLTR